MSPRSWRTLALAHLEMVRPYTMFHAGMVALAAAVVASQGQAPAWRYALAALAVTCGWEAGLYAGDYYDREIDAQSKPDRAIPSGRVTPGEAFGTMVALIAIGGAMALALSPANLALAVATTILGIAYSKALKDRALMGNLDRGVLGIAAALFGALAVGGFGPGVALLCVWVFFHDSATNLVGAIRDVAGDRVAGCRTVPVVYGTENAVWIVIGLVAGWMAAAFALFAFVPRTPLALGLFAVGLALALRVYVPLWRNRAKMTRAQALGAHKYLVAERLVLTSSFIATSLPLAAVLLLAGTLAATLGSQALLRDRYEQQVLRPAPEHRFAGGA